MEKNGHVYYKKIQIHRMLLLINLLTLVWDMSYQNSNTSYVAINHSFYLVVFDPPHHSNTSYVAINQTLGNVIVWYKKNSNTSYVAINPIWVIITNGILINSNTSYVAINRDGL